MCPFLGIDLVALATIGPLAPFPFCSGFVATSKVLLLYGDTMFYVMPTTSSTNMHLVWMHLHASHVRPIFFNVSYEKR